MTVYYGLKRDMPQLTPISTSSNHNIAIVGGGIAGASIALCLSELGLNVTLLEKGPSLVNGPPICHLHAGGNLYREISQQQCLTLLAESIDLLRLYPMAADYRPTIVAVPRQDKGCPEDLLPRLKALQREYQHLIDLDEKNKVLGDSQDYFRLFSREQVESIARQSPVDKPQTLDQWLIPFARYVDLETLKFPIVIVQEYGLNLFRLAASVELSLEQQHNCQILTDANVTDISKSQSSDQWTVNFLHAGRKKQQQFDYLINAAGFRSGFIDDMLGFKRQRLVEFKAAYVSQWTDTGCVWPEVVFYGERSTPQGMAQFTPYPDGFFQLHGMTENITLFKQGLVASSETSSQPALAPDFIKKIDTRWNEHVIHERTQRAIEHISQYIPAFKTAKIGAKPLFGAQQIPGDDVTLRATNVSFQGQRYARCEIVKASSVLNAADAIAEALIGLGMLNDSNRKNRSFPVTHGIAEKEIRTRAEQLATERNYPSSLANVNVAKNA